MKVLSIIVFTVLLVGCRTKQAPITSKKETPKEVQDTPKNEPEEVSDEVFGSFLKKFSADSLFQIQRIEFPFTVFLLRDEETGPEKRLIKRNEWRHLNLTYDEKYATSEMDAFTQEVVTSSQKVTVEIRGVDNGIHIDYDFSLVNGKWFLVAEKDYST